MRRIELAVGLALLMDAALFLAVVPLLPYYADRFGLSTVSAGVVVAAYPVMVLVASVPAGALTGRYGGRRLTILGSALFTLATVMFAFAPSGLALGVARGLQGLASGITWSAGMAWLVGGAAPDRRGTVAGRAMAMVSVGALAGPGLGALAGATSPRAAFAVAAALALVATGVAIASPPGADLPGEASPFAAAVRMLRTPLVVAAMALGTVDSVCSAVVNLLAPLELGRRGLDATEIGGAMILGALLGASLAPVAGRLVDRRGALPTGLPAGLAMGLLPAALAFPLPTWAILGLLLAMNPLFTFIGTAIYPPAAEGAERLGYGVGAAYGLLSISWAVGYAVGPLAGAAIATAGGDAAGYAAAAAAALALVAIAAVAARRYALALSG